MARIAGVNDLNEASMTMIAHCDALGHLESSKLFAGHPAPDLPSLGNKSERHPSLAEGYG